MKSAFSDLKPAAVIGLLFTLPFIVLELINRWEYYEIFPIHIFAVLWLLSTIFSFILVPIIKNLQAGGNPPSNPFNILPRMIFLFLVFIIWQSILMDQIDCFLGVLNCD